MKGRKRHIVVDTLGLLTDVLVHPANIQDRAGGVPLIEKMAPNEPRMSHLWGDSGYTGGFVRFVRRMGWTIEVVTRADDRSHGAWRDEQLPLIPIKPRFELIRRRWVVESTFGWLSRYRRLSKDYEQRIDVSTSMFWAAACRLMAQRLAFA